MVRNNIFISYSHAEKLYLDELLPVLQAVPSTDEGKVLWFDE